VAVMELVAYFEEKLSIRMPDEDLASIRRSPISRSW